MPADCPALASLILFFANFLTIAFARQRLFDSLFLTGFEVKGMTLDFLNDVLGLNFALKTAQGIFERFTFLNSNLCQRKYTSHSRPEWLCIKDTLSEPKIDTEF